ncbi:hypothetical protein BYT27DRAFT_7335933 [Phlegmacium glaucopus]|nr:hypothetical protein BYT27DRAFT_7335933 [Phlegmacium glaucopus]
MRTIVELRRYTMMNYHTKNLMKHSVAPHPRRGLTCTPLRKSSKTSNKLLMCLYKRTTNLALTQPHVSMPMDYVMLFCFVWYSSS